MSKLLFVLLAVLLVGYISGRPEPQPKKDRNDYTKKPYRVVCYFGSWANYHKIDPFKVEDIDGNQCTHVNYAFARLNPSTYQIEMLDQYLDGKKSDGTGLKAYERFNNMRKNNPHLTTIISLGGTEEGSEKFSDMAKDAKHRTTFVQSVLKFLKEHDFDGLDIDWEFPGRRSRNRKVDKKDFVALLKQLRQSFATEGYLLTAAISGVKKTIDIAYDVPELNKLLDWMSVMAYDYHGQEDMVLRHNAPLYNGPEQKEEQLTVNYTINYLLSLGAQKKNLVLGMAFYGKAFTLESQSKAKLNDKAKAASPKGLISGEEGVLGYNEICEMEKKQQGGKWVVNYDPISKASYAHNEKLWVAYENSDSLSCKLAFLKKMGLSGGMIWSIEDDDFMNKCGQGKNPLLHKVNQMLNGAQRDSFECK